MTHDSKRKKLEDIESELLEYFEEESSMEQPGTQQWSPFSDLDTTFETPVQIRSASVEPYARCDNLLRLLSTLRLACRRFRDLLDVNVVEIDSGWRAALRLFYSTAFVPFMSGWEPANISASDILPLEVVPAFKVILGQPSPLKTLRALTFSSRKAQANACFMCHSGTLHTANGEIVSFKYRSLPVLPLGPKLEPFLLLCSNTQCDLSWPVYGYLRASGVVVHGLSFLRAGSIEMSLDILERFPCEKRNCENLASAPTARKREWRALHCEFCGSSESLCSSCAHVCMQSRSELHSDAAVVLCDYHFNTCMKCDKLLGNDSRMCHFCEAGDSFCCDRCKFLFCESCYEEVMSACSECFQGGKGVRMLCENCADVHKSEWHARARKHQLYYPLPKVSHSSTVRKVRKRRRKR